MRAAAYMTVTEPAPFFLPGAPTPVPLGAAFYLLLPKAGAHTSPLAEEPAMPADSA
jgi:hypothetical protein